MRELRIIVLALAVPFNPLTVAGDSNGRPGAVVRDRPATGAGAPARPLSGYTVLVVDPVTVAEGPDTKAFKQGWEAPLHKGIVRQFQKRRIFPEVVGGSVATGVAETVAPAAGSETATKRALLSSTVVLYDKGSRAARFMVGLGAGAAKTRILFVLKDLVTGEELLRLERQGKYAGWLSGTGGTNEEAIMESAGDAVDRLIEEVRKNR